MLLIDAPENKGDFVYSPRRPDPSHLLHTLAQLHDDLQRASSALIQSILVEREEKNPVNAERKYMVLLTRPMIEAEWTWYTSCRSAYRKMYASELIKDIMDQWLFSYATEVARIEPMNEHGGARGLSVWICAPSFKLDPAYPDNLLDCAKVADAAAQKYAQSIAGAAKPGKKK